MCPNILIINPWIHDFAAYDFWAKPLGLLTLAAILRANNTHVFYIDCLDRYHPMSLSKNLPDLRHGKGAYIKTPIDKPEILKDVPRNYCRYGILPNWLEHDLKNIPRPDIILIGSMMTYWYPGIIETIEVVKTVHPNVPIILGGIYSTLCEEHAIKYSGADHVVTGEGESVLIPLISKFTEYSQKRKHTNINKNIKHFFPAFDLQNRIDYIAILTRKGCPYKCAYCASNFLQPNMIIRSSKSVVDEIFYWHKYHKITNFIFYDDALLLEPYQHIVPILKNIIKSGIKINFHTPNALHIKKISANIAKLMFLSGFHTIRLGLETANFKNRQQLDNKVTYNDFKEAIQNLLKAGFKNKQIGVYLLVGLPNQDIYEVKNSIKLVKRMKLSPILAYYSPIPHTLLWEKAISVSRYDLESDPIFTNNAIFPCSKTTFTWEIISELKKIIQI